MANLFNIDAFRAQLAGGGARSTLFRIMLSAPEYVGFPTEKFSMLAKATQLPGSSMGFVEMSYWGRKIKLAGDRTFQDWNATIINDEDFNIRDAFEKWSNSMASYSTEAEKLRVGGATSNPSSYVGSAVIEQYTKTGEIAKSYKLVNLFPTDISPIDVSWEANDQVEEFDVTFAYDYFDPI